jgi:hypothetical protein
LENAVERVAVFSPGPVVEPADVPVEFHLSDADNPTIKTFRTSASRRASPSAKRRAMAGG